MDHIWWAAQRLLRSQKFLILENYAKFLAPTEALGVTMCVCLSVCPSVSKLKLIIFMAQILKQSVSNQSSISQRALRKQSESSQRAVREQSESSQRAVREQSESNTASQQILMIHKVLEESLLLTKFIGSLLLIHKVAQMLWTLAET